MRILGFSCVRAQLGTWIVEWIGAVRRLTAVLPHSGQALNYWQKMRILGFSRVRGADD